MTQLDAGCKIRNDGVGEVQPVGVVDQTLKKLPSAASHCVGYESKRFEHLGIRIMGVTPAGIGNDEYASAMNGFGAFATSNRSGWLLVEKVATNRNANENEATRLITTNLGC